MATSNDNPFVMPGMGQFNSEIAGNPLLASMEMMRQAWAGLTGPGGLANALPTTPPLNVEELDRRIAELKSVESWLTMNLSMLSSTIQGMEVQRSTLNTLRAFVDVMAQAPDAQTSGQSPLEAALGIRRPPSRQGKPMWPDTAPAGAASPGAQTASVRPTDGSAAPGAMWPDTRQTSQPVETSQSSQSSQPSQPSQPSQGFAFGMPDDVVPGGNAPAGGAQSASTPDGDANAKAESTGMFGGAQAAQSASKAWFDLLQQQFQTIAQATAAASTLPGSGAADGASSNVQGSRAAAAEAGGKTAGTHKGAGTHQAKRARQTARTAPSSTSSKAASAPAPARQSRARPATDDTTSANAARKPTPATMARKGTPATTAREAASPVTARKPTSATTARKAAPSAKARDTARATSARKATATTTARKTTTTTAATRKKSASSAGPR